MTQSEKKGKIGYLEWASIVVTVVTVILSIYTAAFEFGKAKVKLDQMEEQLKVMQQDIAYVRDLGKRLSTLSAVPIKNEIFDFKKLDLKENIDEKSKANILRLFDNAEFAINNKDYEYAQELYKEANSIHETVLSYYYIANLLYNKGDLEKSELYLKKALSMRNAYLYPELYFYLGNIYELQGRSTEAKKILGKYVESK